MKNAGKLSILLPLSIGFCATVLAVAGGLSANVAYANEANEASAANAANPNEVQGNKKESNSSQEEADKYPTVTFMNGDSTIATVQVKKGKTTGEDTPSDLKDTGYTFIGWSTTKGATSLTQVDFKSDTAVNANTTVYAVFAKDDNEPAKKHTVTFKIDDACFDTASVENGKTIGNSMPSAPSKTGYTFLGWSTTKGATEQSKVDFTVNTAVSADTTVYAVFKREPKMVTVTFKNLSYMGDDDYSTQVEQGTTVTPPIGHSIAGYEFVKWCAREDGKAPAFDFSKKITKDISIYAIFKAKSGGDDIIPPDEPPIIPPDWGPSINTHMVTFYNGNQIMTAVEVNHGEGVEDKKMPKPSRDGYTFLGWSTHSDASDKSDVNFYAGTIVNSDKDVYAVFQQIPVVMYDVTFKNDDAWLSTIYVEKGKKLDSDGFPANPTKTGYDFVGWSTKKNASSADFSVDLSINADTTVYAVFEAKPYKLSHSVTFKNDGSWIKTVTVKDGETVTEENMPSTHAKTGYEFVGWSTTDGASEANFTANTAVSSDKTVYAVFKKDEHTVKVEVLVAKMTYKGSSDLTFKSTNKKSDPIDGKRITNGEGTVTHNIPATDGVTEVGNKEITYEDITPGITYEADSSLAYNTTKETEGTKGTRKIEKFYGVDSTTGAIGSLGGSNSEITINAINKVVKVGNVEKTTTSIKFKTEYKADANTPYNTQVTETEGRDGESTTTKTYVVDASTGALSNPTTSTHETKATNKVVKVGNVKKTTANIDFKTIYVADGNLDYKATSETAGQKGKEEIALTYKVDATKGLTKDVESKKSLCTKPVDHVIRVGNVKTETKVIEFTTEYIDDDSLAEGTEQVTTQGQDGSEKVVTTYKVDPTNGLTTKVEKTETKDHKDPVKQVVHRGTKKNPPKPPQPDPDPDPNPNPDPDSNPDPNPEPDPTDPDDNNGGGSIDPDWTYNPELNIGSGNDDNSSTNSNGSMNASANGSDSTSSFDALQAEGTRSADALPNTGSNASGTTFASFGAMVLGLFVASGAAVNRKRAKHLR